MEQINDRSGSDCGGIIGLVRILRKHDRALEYDLMTRTGRTINEYLRLGAAGKVALISFIRYLPPDSALYQDMNPKDEFGAWYSTMKTNAILADIYDVFVAANTRKGKQVKTYPRPVEKRGLGKDAIPISEFWDWWNKKE